MRAHTRRWGIVNNAFLEDAVRGTVLQFINHQGHIGQRHVGRVQLVLKLYVSFMISDVLPVPNAGSIMWNLEIKSPARVTILCN